MADDSSSLFCDDDETCEKNVSESEDDGETYVSAPIGKIRIDFSGSFLSFVRFFSSNLHCCRPTRIFSYNVMCFAFVRTHSQPSPLQCPIL